MRFKVCCIKSVEEALLAVRYGASAIGLVSEMPSGPGVIDEETITQIAAKVPPGVATFLLTSKQKSAEIIDQQKRCRTNTVQLCDSVEDSVYHDLRCELAGIKIVQVIHVIDDTSLKEALHVAPFVDALLLDSGNPRCEVKELGGTGRTHNWTISKQIVDQTHIPVFLAGGLNASNAAQAIQTVTPYAIDICSGLRTNNHLNESKLQAFADVLKKG